MASEAEKDTKNSENEAEDYLESGSDEDTDSDDGNCNEKSRFYQFLFLNYKISIQFNLLLPKIVTAQCLLKLRCYCLFCMQWFSKNIYRMMSLYTDRNVPRVYNTCILRRM